MIDRGRVGAKKDLGQSLVEGAFLKRQDLATALETSRRTGKKLTEVLLETRLVSPETLATVLSFHYGAPLVDLNQYEVQPEAVALIPEETARRFNVLPLRVEGEDLMVAMEDPGDLQAIDALAGVTRKRVRPLVPVRGGVREMLGSYYRLTPKIEEQITQAVTEAQPTTAQARVAAETAAIAPEAIGQAPVVRAVDMVLTQAVKDRASDIHIQPQEDGLRVRYRIDGVLQDVVTLPIGVHQALVSRIKVMANMNIAERRRPQDGAMSGTYADRAVDFRVATVETSFGEMVVLRILDKSTALHELPEIGMSPQFLEQHKRMLDSPFGMVMVSGPTGSGKTTTLYASLAQFNPREYNIMTIEDPIEYHFKGVNQIQVNRQADITFAAGLRAIMRLDPDIILVGEIRDKETATVAVNAALTGHLVLTTIHANDAVGALVRLIDLGVEPFLVTSGVIATLSQRLVRKVCPYCRAIGPVPPQEAAAYQQEMGEVRTDFYYGRGCNFCSRTGYLGRIGVFEMLTLSEPIRQLVNRQASSSEIRAQALREGMVTMRRDGMLKARDGITTPGEVIRNVFVLV